MFDFASRLQVVQSKFTTQVYDVRHRKSVSKYPTIADVISVRDPNVLNILIDQKDV